MTSTPSYRFILAVFLPVLFVISACDSGGSNGDETTNEFSLTVTTTNSSGAMAKAVSDTTIRGYSFFYAGQNPDTGEEVFSIYMSGNDSFSDQSAQDGLYGFLARQSSRPNAGEYDVVHLEQEIDSGNFIGVLFEDVGSSGSNNEPFYVPDGGTVTLTSSTSDRVEGRVDLTAEAISFNFSGATASIDTTDVQISGEFSARNVEQFANLARPSSQSSQ